MYVGQSHIQFGLERRAATVGLAASILFFPGCLAFSCEILCTSPSLPVKLKYEPHVVDSKEPNILEKINICKQICAGHWKEARYPQPVILAQP